MIKETNIKLKLNAKTIKHYWDIGYSGTTGDIININIDDLTKGSHVLITAICHKCQIERNIPYKSYLKNFSNNNMYLCHKCCDDKKKLTSLKNYGVERPLQSKIVLDKLQNTNRERYGVNHYMLTNEFLNNDDINNRRKQTRIKNGNQILDNDYNNWINYQRIVRNETRRIKKKILLEWDGYDYYDNEYIKCNLNKYESGDLNYPTLDHKISLRYGFENGIQPLDLCNISNICVTKNKHNISKGILCNNDYKIKINNNDEKLPNNKDT